MQIKYEVHLLKWDEINFTASFDFVSCFTSEELAEKFIRDKSLKGRSYCIIKTYDV